ncbi:MAG: ABC transporter ATP-binding protein [Sulfolobales archaeon]|nr:ABC transporter ATP-binding protein [Sulfolobales archaeon]
MKVELKNVVFSYDTVKAVDSVTLEFDSGRISCLVGPNGSGKTTTLKLVASLIKPSEGVVYIDGKDVRTYSASEIAKLVSYSDPHLPKTLPMKVVDFILTSRYPHHRALQYFESREDIEVVEEVAKELDIVHILDRKLEQLSSGELQRVVVAASLAKKPRVLLLDEPSAFLDIRYRFEIMDLVKKYTEKRGAVTVVALHDLHLASLYCDRVYLLYRGRIVASGSPLEVFTSESIERVYGVKVETVQIGRSQVVAIPVPAESSKETPATLS